VVRVNAPTVVRGNNAEVTTPDRIWNEVGVKVAPLDDPSLVAGTIYEGGLRVTTIRPGSPAALGGMQDGDVLVGLHRWATMSEDNIIYIIDQSEVKDAATAVTFYVLRNRVPRPLKGELNLAGK
jgi:serine protease Do